MSFPLINRYTGTVSLLFAAALTWTSIGAQAQGAATGPARRAAAPQRAPQDGAPPADNLPKQLPGELVVRLAPGMTADALSEHFGLSIKRKLRYAPNTYILKGTPAVVEKIRGQLIATPGVLKVVDNKLGRFNALPAVRSNDPLVSEQWPLRLMGATNLWGVTVGERLVNGPIRNAKIGLLDSGIQSDHPDLAANMDPNGWDFTNNLPHDDFNINFFLEDHGTAMAGCMATVTNNFEGLSSVSWEGVTILPCEIGDFVTVNNVTSILPSTGYAIDAIYYCIEQGVDVISMSFGVGQDDLLEQACQDAFDSGVVLVGASGNNRFFGTSFGVSFPASLDTVIAVGAVGPSGELAYYSDGGPELDVVAPGGNDSNFSDFSRQVLSTDGTGFSVIFGFPPGYEYGQGTSQATAFTAGAIATLITQGARDEDLTPQEHVLRIKSILEKTARSPLGQRSDEFGAGLINVFAALREVTPVIDVAAPVPNEITASFGEPFQASISRNELIPAENGIPGDYVKQPVPLLDTDFNVFHNGTSIIDQVEIVDSEAGLIGYAPNSNTRYAIGNNRINIVVDHPLLADTQRSLEGPAVGRIPARVFQFRVQPRVEQPGLKLVSFPFELQTDADDSDEIPGPDSLSFLVGSNPFKVARYLTGQSRYAIWDTLGSPQEPEADLVPPPARDLDPNDPDSSDEIFQEVGVRRPPIGIGYWARVSSQTQLQILGKSERSGTYEIRLLPGFNLIGNPYPFRVPWNVVNVRFGNEVMSVQEAASRNLMRNTLWRWENGRYTFNTLPHGELREFEGHWVRAFREVTLIVPRIAATVSSSVASAAPATDAAAWTASIEAKVGSQTAGEVVLGATDKARNGYGPEDVETPPTAPAQSTLRVRNGNWGRESGAYAQDLRQVANSAQRWTLEVETYKAGQPVKLSWDAFPAGSRAQIRTASGEVHTLTRQGSFQFTPKRAGLHQLVVTAVPVAG